MSAAPPPLPPFTEETAIQKNNYWTVELTLGG
jgi:nuclear transport factor 2 (NTF2) superfamily protein